MKRVALALIAFMLLASQTLFASAAESEPIRIGAVASVTGAASFLGEPEKNTLEWLTSKINAEGGILGRKVQLIVVDDESDVNKAVLGAEKLIKREKVVAGIGGTTSANTLAIVPKFAAAQVPLVSMAAAEKIVKPVNPFIFKVAPTDRLAADKIMRHAKALGQTKLAILTASDTFGQAGREGIKAQAQTLGMALVADEVFANTDTDMTAQMTKIKDSGAQAVLCWGTSPGPAKVAMAHRQLGLTIPLYMSHGVASKRFIEMAGEAAEGIKLPAGKIIVAAQLPDSDPQKAQLLEYTKIYESTYKQPVSTFGGHGYDALMIIKLAIEAAQSTEPAKIREKLETLSGVAGIGGVFRFTPDDHEGLSDEAFVIVEIKGGDWRLINP